LALPCHPTACGAFQELSTGVESSACLTRSIDYTIKWEIPRKHIRRYYFYYEEKPRTAKDTKVNQPTYGIVHLWGALRVLFLCYNLPILRREYGRDDFTPVKEYLWNPT
jgi:hypothetical protein